MSSKACECENQIEFSAKKLCEHLEADVNKKDERGNTALFKAAKNEDSKTVELLIKAGADVNIKCEWGKTALFNAVDNNRHKTVELLLLAGADVNMKDVSGETVLFLRGIMQQIMELLLNAGADVNMRGSPHSDSALMLAALRNEYIAVEMLIKAGADVNVTNFQGDNPLNMCVLDCSPRTVKLILNAGAKVNCAPLHGRSVLEQKLDFLTSRDIFKPNGQEVMMLLFAAGCPVDFKHIEEEIPEYLEQFLRPDSSLKDLSRRAVRKQLIKADDHVNLFKKIADNSESIGLPSVLEDYLLYNMSLNI